MKKLLPFLLFAFIFLGMASAAEYRKAPTANDTVYGAPWNGSTTEVPSQNVLWDKIETIAGGAQTPWTSDINGSTFNLTTTGTINATQLQVAGVNVSTSTYTNSTAYNATGWTKSGNWVNTTVAGDNVSISGLLNITPSTDLIPLTLKGLLGGSADLLEAYNGTILRTELFSGGSQNWYFGATGAESAIKYSTPGGYPGITLNYNAATALASLGSKSGQANWGRAGEYGFKHYTGGYMELGQSSDTTASRAQLDIYNSVGTTKVGLSVQGAASQTGNLQQWSNSTGTVLATINATGAVGIGNATPGSLLDIYGSVADNTAQGLTISAAGVARNRIYMYGSGNYAAVIRVGNANGALYYMDGGGVTRLVLNQEGISINTGTGGATSALHVGSTNTSRPVVIVKGAASQTGDLQQWQNSTGTVLACVNATGNVGIGTATPATILDVNGVINATGGNSTYWNAKPGNSAIHFTITNGTSALSTGWAGQVMAINNFTITSVKTISTDFTKGNITIRVGKFIPNAGIQNYTAANFTTCGNLTLASAQYNNDTTLTGWNTTVTAGELFGLNVTAADTVKSVYVIIR